MHQSVKLTGAIWLLLLAISSPVIHALGDTSQAPTGFEPGSPAWEADDLPTKLSLPPIMFHYSVSSSYVQFYKWTISCTPFPKKYGIPLFIFITLFPFSDCR